MLRKLLDLTGKYFQPGRRLHRLYPLYEAADTLLYNTSRVTSGRTHVRDALDLKRLMSTVILALVPCILMALYNTGLQVNTALAGSSLQNWRGVVISWLGLGHDPGSLLNNFVLGALYFVPVYLVVQLAGGFWEVLFAVVRRHEINEGFFVTGMLFPLILPHDIPLWQAALGISFGVVMAKEVFGGTGFNFLNPALAARAFIFFAYPQAISGNKVWVNIDSVSIATPLAAVGEKTYSWLDSFLGFVPGSMGETSALACIMGAFILLVTGVASWRIMLSIVLSMSIWATLFNYGSPAGADVMYHVAWYEHLVMGGFAFGTVFMATDPVTGCVTNMGKYIY
ncbi:MAG TPA: NADH:ubiquinone reductase (Na(+)-transporting) subunit B, partial [Spirochaetota bacterium]|nr:NADH:ubiquinone reductase (Na(+)-transporting) subunit B [Spirochaetota bacterium]